MKFTLTGVGDVEGHPIATYPDSYTLPGENKLRPGFMASEGNDTVVFETGPDIRQQLLHENVKDITAVFVTHAHFDHFWGIHDLAQLNWVSPIKFPIYINQHIRQYLDKYMPWLKLPFEIYEYGRSYQFDKFIVTPYKVDHSESFETASFLIETGNEKRVFYAPDFKGLAENKCLNCDIAVIDGCFFFGKYLEDNDDHFDPERLKKQIAKLGAKTNYLVGVSPFYYKKTTDELRKLLPSGFVLPDNFDFFEV